MSESTEERVADDRPSGPAQRPLRVLLVEDSHEHAKLAAIWIEEEGHARFEVTWVERLSAAPGCARRLHVRRDSVGFVPSRQRPARDVPRNPRTGAAGARRADDRHRRRAARASGRPGGRAGLSRQGRHRWPAAGSRARLRHRTPPRGRSRAASARDSADREPDRPGRRCRASAEQSARRDSRQRDARRQRAVEGSPDAPLSGRDRARLRARRAPGQANAGVLGPRRLCATAGRSRRGHQGHVRSDGARAAAGRHAVARHAARSADRPGGSSHRSRSWCSTS